MSRNVVGCYRMSLRVSQIWIALIFKQGLRESAVGLVHPYQIATVRQVCDFHAASLEDRCKRVNAVRCWLNEIAEEFASASRTHGVFSDRIEPSQPLHAVLRRMLQQ